MSDEQQALLNAILANPDDDLVRLVYADWLDEHGQPERAEFIRLQIEMTRLDENSDECRALQGRQNDLLEAHREQWAAQAGFLESNERKADFQRGFMEGLRLFDCSLAELNAAVRIPGLRHLSLGRLPLTTDAIRLFAALELDSLAIYDTPFPREWLHLLEPLPPGTVLVIKPAEGEFDRDFWHEFQSRRIGRLATLPPESRYAEARRWQRGRCEHHRYFRKAGNGWAIVEDVRACDVEMQLLAELWDVEDVKFWKCDLTATGIELIARLPKLKRLDLRSGRFESIAPLSRCVGLEELTVWPDYQVALGDTGTEGLEHLVNLRNLQLRPQFGAHTLTRLGSLRKLVSLDIEIEDGLGAESFAPLSHLTALEQLTIDGDVPGGALRFLVSCTKLQRLTLRVPTGNANDFAAFARLTELRELHITGFAVADEALQHLAPLKKLHRVDAQKTLVLPAGARWLADQLPEVTVTLDKYVAKSPRTTMTFCRRLSQRDDFVSALLPTQWEYSRGWTTAEPTVALVEDGWGDDRHGTVTVSPATMYCYGIEGSDSAAVLNDFLKLDNPNYQPAVEARDVVELAGNVASCIYRVGNSRSLVVALANDGKCAVLECNAPQSRFEEFRPLFLFVARSLRVGEAARQGIGEEVTVAVADL